jgi:hypothetical protein
LFLRKFYKDYHILDSFLENLHNIHSYMYSKGYFLGAYHHVSKPYRIQTIHKYNYTCIKDIIQFLHYHNIHQHMHM